MYADVSKSGVVKALMMRMVLIVVALVMADGVGVYLAQAESAPFVTRWDWLIAAGMVLATSVALMVGTVYAVLAARYAARARAALDMQRDRYTIGHRQYVSALEDAVEAAGSLLKGHDRDYVDDDAWQYLRDQLRGVNDCDRYAVYTGDDRNDVDEGRLPPGLPPSAVYEDEPEGAARRESDYSYG